MNTDRAIAPRKRMNTERNQWATETGSKYCHTVPSIGFVSQRSTSHKASYLKLLKLQFTAAAEPLSRGCHCRFSFTSPGL